MCWLLGAKRVAQWGHDLASGPDRYAIRTNEIDREKEEES
jgi:hypothetical protein